LSAYHAALDAVRGDRLVSSALSGMAFDRPVMLVAAGKAAPAMARGAAGVLGDRIDRGLVVGTEDEDGHWPFPCRAIAAEHPVPGEGSLAAGEELLDLLEQTPAEQEVLFLISGGASSLVEAPAPGVDLDDLRRANEWLLASGLDIGRVNAVRRRLSRIKGGGLACYLDGRKALVLALSDVPGNDPAVIGSGWLARPAEAVLPAGLPGWLTELAGQAPASPAADDPAWDNIHIEVIGDNRTALDAAAETLAEAGLGVRVVGERLEGEAAEQGRAIARELTAGGEGVVLRGGECTVKLPASAGRGGRCQHLALAAAEVLAGRDDCWLLAAGTDGRDGNSDAAGALVDGGTVQRGEREGRSAREALEGADSGSFLDEAGDLVDTGPTGTNVNDLVIGLKT
jgi:hydroxypyruvate reductase